MHHTLDIANACINPDRILHSRNAEIDSAVGFPRVTLEDEEYEQVSHLFIVQNSLDSLIFHASCQFTGAKSHLGLALKYGIDEEQLVGGGVIYVDRKTNNLFITNYSGDYGSIPFEYALLFGHKLLHQKLPVFKDLKVSNCIASPNPEKQRSFWDPY